MRCKNCGSQNDDNLYICQNCGSPLYDEDEAIENAGEGTRVFATLDDPHNTQTPMDAAADRAAMRRAEEEERKKKQQIATIVILVIILLAIIIGTVIAVAHKKNAAPEISTSDISVSEQAESTSESTTQAQSSTTETTTEATTTTTETTTEATTAAEPTFCYVNIDSNAGGNVNGDGRYELGDNVTLIARPDSGYAFDGWYKGGSKVSSKSEYTFTITEDVSLKAVFTLVNDEPETEGNEGIDVIDGEEVSE